MDERTLSKIIAARKANRFLAYVFLVLVVFLLLQFLTIENKGRWLFDSSWKAAQQHFYSRIGSDPDSTSISSKAVAACIPRAVFFSSGDEKRVTFTGAQVKCLREVLATSLKDGDVSSVSGDPGGQAPEIEEEQEKFVKLNKGLEEENVKLGKEVEGLRNDVKLAEQRLKQSVHMMELKDLRQPGQTRNNTNWFMSSLHGTVVDGKAEEFRFPSNISQGRLLCLQGNHTSNGTMNKYGFAWRESLPENAVLLPGLTLVADNYWDYVNPWHSMSAVVNFAAWRSENGCPVPSRIITYHWGEVVPRMGDWITNVLHASLGTWLKPDTLSYGTGPVCFEDAVVNRRGIGGMSRPRMNKLFDMIRCKVYQFCKVVPRSYFMNNKEGKIDLTLLARTGAREFSNLPAVVSVVSEQCKLVNGCELHVVPISNLSFCQQVEVMSKTDILLTSHGAQLTNMMFMPKGGSVMELFPKGWLEYAGIGQYIYSWLTDWTELNHEGTWRDPEGPDCPYPTTEALKCFIFYKDRPVGLNATHLSSWTAQVLQKLQARRPIDNATQAAVTNCSCDNIDNAATVR